MKSNLESNRLREKCERESFHLLGVDHDASKDQSGRKETPQGSNGNTGKYTRNTRKHRYTGTDTNEVTVYTVLGERERDLKLYHIDNPPMNPPFYFQVSLVLLLPIPAILVLPRLPPEKDPLRIPSFIMEATHHITTPRPTIHITCPRPHPHPHTIITTEDTMDMDTTDITDITTGGTCPWGCQGRDRRDRDRPRDQCQSREDPGEVWDRRMCTRRIHIRQRTNSQQCTSNRSLKYRLKAKVVQSSLDVWSL